MSITPAEQHYLDTIKSRLEKLRHYLNNTTFPQSSDFKAWFDYLARVREIQGNSSNDTSFLATMLAKSYLAERFELGKYDSAEKAQGAPGLDINLITTDGKRVIAEIKTTVPYSAAATRNDLGAQQKASFQKDFDKLNHTIADFKYLFVTDRKTFEVLNKRFANLIPGVTIVLLERSAELSEGK